MDENRTKLYDKDIREPLFDYLEEKFGKTRVFEEKIIGRARADILLLTEDSIIGIEIKSDADSYERLKKQVRYYNKYCDLNYIAVGITHSRHVEKHVPKEWGILIIVKEKDEILITEKREPLCNPKMKKDSQITLMWRPELQRVLEMNKLPKYKQKSKKFVQQKVIEKIEWQQLKLQMCDQLFERDYTLWDEELEEYKRQNR